ncbi:MAG: amino acid racemase [Deltaproteobacteria bacterium]|nr:amino acid racemase [Deltaproteobacteria bacterium]MBW2303420.1 amino acid racemase [Deltaproteobacteria bacterium]
MKKIGIVGGLGPESTLYYYRIFTNLCYSNPKLEGSMPEILIYSLNLQECLKIMEAERWSEMAQKILDAFFSLFRAGANFGLIAANTPHKVFDVIKEECPIPLISIVEATCMAVKQKGLSRVGLFGTLTTMGSSFYRDVFERHGITIEIPEEKDRDYICEKISRELGVGIIREETRRGFLDIAEKMRKENSIEGLILGCTEIPLLLGGEDIGMPFFDTSRIHVESALEYSMNAS